MSDISIFPDKELKPSDKDLIDKLGSTYKIWNHIYQFTMGTNPILAAEWNYAGKKFGWSFRIRDKKRVIIYLLPRNGYFKVAFVFGDKAMNEILDSSISKTIQEELIKAPKYAEGRGIRLDVKDKLLMGDIEQLVIIKLKH